MWPFQRSAAPNFTCERDIPPQQGKVILITGGNSGLGKQAALEFARRRPSHIYLSSRTLEKAESAIADIHAALKDEGVDIPPPISPLVFDLASLATIKVAAQTFLATAGRLDILMLNAGIMATPPGLTKDGYEMQFGTNHLGHALLAKLLMPLLLKTADGPPPGREENSLSHSDAAKADVRIVVLTSVGMGLAPSGGIQFDTLSTTADKMTAWARYGQSKLANTLYARELAARNSSLTVTAIHPGGVATNLMNPMAEGSTLLRAVKPLVMPFMTTIEKGVRNQMWASVGKPVSGEYYVPVAVESPGPTLSRSDELRKKLWEWTENALKEYEL